VIEFADNSAQLPAQGRQQIEAAAKLYAQRGGLVRVIGQAMRGAGADASAQELASFRLAIDRANAVSAALQAAGVPQAAVRAEAAPISAAGAVAGSPPRGADIFIEY
jgi:outer membrane protein OmpA-like peptidoglycan-associated protein